MKIGGSLYRDGQKLGEIVYVNALAFPDSKNPLMLTSGNATQYFIIARGARFPANDHSRGRWEVGGEAGKRQINVMAYNPQDEFHIRLTAELTKAD